MDYFKFQNVAKPKVGDLLISEPFMPDDNFSRSVVLLTEHNDKGSVGFILNKTSEFKLDELIQLKMDNPVNVFRGGPVELDTLHFIHQKNDNLNYSSKVSDNIYWGLDFNEVLALMELDQIEINDFKFFMGYCGWDAGQLEKEISENSWIVYRGGGVEEIFDTPSDTLWSELLNDMGTRFKIYSNYPIDPRLN
ncbi:YqgE/AlgH family protein [Aureibacter tunicatorum]|uniref:Transcriptional regulator n=1 Tax=Aureibacter tunicatorum TaxID=866807 RepID=A0AAE3XPZ9_9BACT|nr:YqgE/AlgH family protein [Aureibacter tunicatorum]MDR6239821.1 putative transcriptional regulator [Aureibacter tunicatorum]BDD04296.1 transcriptional regulator [Aureibacter tunicatorum]